MITEAILEAKAKKIKQYPVNSNRASELGHPCLRYLVLLRTRWQEKPLHDADLQMVFDMGHEVERMCENDLREAGIIVVEQHRPFSWDKYGLTGYIDLKIGVTEDMIRRELESGKLPDDIKMALGEAWGKWSHQTGNLTDYVLVPPVEIKSSAPHVWEGINTIQDMMNHKYLYMRKYPAQLTLYLVMDNKEIGLFLFKNKQTGQIKEIWMKVDWDYAETLVGRAERVNNNLAENRLPVAIPYDDDICGGCGFNHICLPERIGKEVKVIDNDRIIELLNIRERLQESASEYRHADEEVKKLVHGQDKILVGDWFITGSWHERQGKPYWKPSFIKTSGK